MALARRSSALTLWWSGGLAGLALLQAGRNLEALPDALRLCARLQRAAAQTDEVQLPPLWAEFFLGLADDRLTTAKKLGLGGVMGLPASLKSWMEDLEWLEHQLLPCDSSAPEGQAFRTKKKKAELLGCSSQVHGVQKVLQQHFRTSHVRRLVDLGCGAGALTRQLSQAMLIPTLGLDRNPQQVRLATKLAGPSEHSDLTFRCCDIQNASALQAALQPGDLVVGLHPCGSLGDYAIQALVESEVKPGLLMVSCCLQGRAWAPVPDPRSSVSHLGQALNLSLPRLSLQRSNLWARSAHRAATNRRGVLHTRLALRRLLQLRGRQISGLFETTPSLRGLGRDSWEQQASRAMEREGLPPPTYRELQLSTQWATSQLPRHRRLGCLGPQQIVYKTLLPA
eukprot:s1212_g13.t4